jgi:uridine kinase
MNHDFDHPNALDFKQIEDCMRDLRESKDTSVPLYSFKTNAR